jgi:CO/xanthine dehydrogenase FAD-binding subunit
VMLKDRIINVEHIINIKSIAGLDSLEWNENDGLRIGALIKISDICKSGIIREKYPSLRKAAETLGSPQVRNMATIGGNICRSSPSAYTPLPLMVFGARLRLAGTKGEQVVPIEEFFTGPGKNVLDCEILTEIILPVNKEVHGTAFGKISRVSEDLAKVNCAVKIELSGKTCSSIRIVLGAVAATPVRAWNVERAIMGREITDRLIEAAAENVNKDISPIDDVRSTAEYRYRVSRILIKRLVKEATKSAEQAG